MKKALAILLALSMVFAAFADEPATNYSVAEFSGSAEFGYKVDLDDAKNGMFNDASAKLKINLLNGGDKSTAAADGVWGELKIKVNTPDALENPGTLEIKAKDSDAIAFVDTAKIHFVDGDVGVALNIKTPSLKLADDYDVMGCAPVSEEYALASALVKACEKTLEEAEKGYDAQAILDAKKLLDDAKKALEKIEAPAALTNGFAVEVTTSAIDVNVKVMDNGVAAKKVWGFGGDLSVKAIENASLKAAFAYAFDTTAVTASADYKIAIDDTLYVKPAVDYKMIGKDTKSLTGSLLFAWGDAEDPGFLNDGARKDDNNTRFVGNGIDNGVKVSYNTSLAENDKGSISVAVYDGTLVEGLKVGATYGAKLDKIAEGDVAFAVKYGTDIDIITLSADFGLSTSLVKDSKLFYGYALNVSTDDVIDNTSLYVNYQAGEYKTGADAGFTGSHEKGTVTVGAKISL